MARLAASDSDLIIWQDLLNKEGLNGSWGKRCGDVASDFYLHLRLILLLSTPENQRVLLYHAIIIILLLLNLLLWSKLA